MKYETIVERWQDFEIGTCYCVISENKVIDTFICNSIDRAAIHLQTYTNRGCEIWRYMTDSEVREKLQKLHDEESVHYELFSRSKRLASSELAKMCEISTFMNRLRKVFCNETH